jgi:D-arginine dehydrogenase
MTHTKCDFLIVGGGIAGASAAYELAQHGKVIILERESQPDYHSSGRSSASFVETYGDDVVRALNTGSRPFLENPPEGFCDQPLLSGRGCLHVARTDQLPLLDELVATTGQLVDNLKRLNRDEISELVPIMNSDVIVAAVLEPGAMDLDVNALHQGFLRGCAARGGELHLNTEVLELSRQDGVWHAETPSGTYTAPTVINAAGAWVDTVAELAGVAPLGVVPKRRTVFTFRTPDEFPCADWPLVIDASEEYYFKASGGFLMVTPADETPVPPSDVQPEEIDVAIAVDRLEKNTCLKVGRIEHKWAGLRTFSADKTPIVGMDPTADGFFWLAGQGGYGFQTSAAMARMATCLLTENSIPQDLIDLGVDRNRLSPGRFRSS